MDKKDKTITLRAAAEFSGISYHTIRGAANRYLSRNLDSGSTLECWRSDFQSGGGKVILTKESFVNDWKRNRSRPGQYSRK